jgi:cyclohexanecarboxylate-CoA ligase
MAHLGPTIWSLLEQRVSQTPDGLTAVDERGSRLTFREFHERVLAVAAGLRDAGISSSSTVSWMLPTWQESLVLTMALARLGATQNPIIPIYRQREVDFIVEQIDARHLFVPSQWRGFDYAEMAAEIASARPALHVHVADRTLPTGDPASLASVPPPGSADEVRWLFFTSGTTASPKGAKHSDRTLIAAARGLADRLQITATDRSALVFPVTHIAGPIWIVASLLTGACNLLVEKFDVEASSEFLAREGVTLAGPGASFIAGYLTAQRRDPQTPLFPAVRCCPCGGAPRPPHLHEAAKRELGGAGVLSAWGLTEAPIVTCATYDDTEECKALFEGGPVDGATVVAVDEKGTELPAGAEGELVVSAPQLMLGYVDEALNSEAFDGLGRLRTGDLGVVDADGYVRITGRKKDVIIRHGENISAKEVEDLLHDHPRVADVAVVGLPHPATGEIACAVVQLVEPHDRLELQEVQDFLRAAGLRNQALPERLELRDELPRDPSGKVVKRVLRAQYESSAVTR